MSRQPWPAHEAMYPDCAEPLPHGHDLGRLASRGPYPGWTLQDDGYLDEPVPELRHKLIHRDGWVVCSAPDCSYMRPDSRRRGCLYWVLACVVVLVAAVT